MTDELILAVRQAVNNGVEVRVSVNTADVRNIILTAGATIVAAAFLIILLAKRLK